MIERLSPNIEYVFELKDAMNKKFTETKLKLPEMCNKYRAYYDCKAEAKPLAIFSYCLLLNPKLMTQSDFASQSLPIWLPPYRIQKILTNSNYIFRKFGTNYTQCVHKIRLRPVTPQGRINDLTVINFLISKIFKETHSWATIVVNQRYLMKVFLLCWNLPPQWLQHKM